MRFCPFAMFAIFFAANFVQADATEIPDLAGQTMLIRNTLTAVNHAALTGNYTVLRDLGSVRFREKNTAADLGAAFSELRRRKLDLSPVLIADPILTQDPTVDRYGALRLVGQVPTRPQSIQFDIIFQSVKGGWLVDEISVRLVPHDKINNQIHPADGSESTANQIGKRLLQPSFAR